MVKSANSLKRREKRGENEKRPLADIGPRALTGLRELCNRSAELSFC